MDRVINYGQRGVHEMALASKAIIQAYYSGAPAHSLFPGLFLFGGQQALTRSAALSHRFRRRRGGRPRQLVHAALHRRTHVDRGCGRGRRLAPSHKVQILADVVNAACDVLDGVKDGVLNDPRRCHFDPALLQCKPANSPNCLTGAQVAAVRKIWTGMRDAGGEQL